MAFVIQGTQVSEFSEKTGPKGKTLKGEGETGLASHREACASIKKRAKDSVKKTTVGFPDTPEVQAAFDALHGKKKKDPDPERARDPELGRLKVEQDKVADPEIARMRVAQEAAAASSAPIAPRGAETEGGDDDAPEGNDGGGGEDPPAVDNNADTPPAGDPPADAKDSGAGDGAVPTLKPKPPAAKPGSKAKTTGKGDS